MKVGYIVEPNKKGQIVIPKRIRDELEIDENVSLNVVLRGEGIYLEPIESFVPRKKGANLQLEVLKKTAGSWAGDNWPVTEKKRKKFEIAASKKRKKQW